MWSSGGDKRGSLGGGGGFLFLGSLGGGGAIAGATEAGAGRLCFARRLDSVLGSVGLARALVLTG